MRRIEEHRWLPALLVLATLATQKSVLFGQPPEQAPAQAPVASPQPQPTRTFASPTPEPEDIGDSLMAHQRYQAAIEAYKKVQKRSADVLNKMGIAYQMMFDMDDATRCYQESLKLDQKNTHVLNNLGTVYDSAKQYRSAERMYRKALKIDPRAAVIEKNLGTNLMAQHKYKPGWDAYQAALAIDPHIFENSSSPHTENPASVQNRGAMNYYMAKTCVRAGMIDRAIEYLRVALNEGFTNPKKIIADGEFASLRGIPAFEQLLVAQGNPVTAR